jgi:hypothetical protein
VRNGEFDFPLIVEVKEGKRLDFPTIAIQADGYLDANLEDLDCRMGRKSTKNSCHMDCSDKLVQYTNFKLSDTTKSITYAKEDQ